MKWIIVEQIHVRPSAVNNPSLARLSLCDIPPLLCMCGITLSL